MVVIEHPLAEGTKVAAMVGTKDGQGVILRVIKTTNPVSYRPYWTYVVQFDNPWLPYPESLTQAAGTYVVGERDIFQVVKVEGVQPDSQ